MGDSSIAHSVLALQRKTEQKRSRWLTLLVLCCMVFAPWTLSLHGATTGNFPATCYLIRVLSMCSSFAAGRVRWGEDGSGQWLEFEGALQVSFLWS